MKSSFLRKSALSLMSVAVFIVAGAMLASAADVVYVGFSKDLKGTAVHQHVKDHKCVVLYPAAGPLDMCQVKTTMTGIPVVHHSPCDEFPWDGRLSTTWNVLLRTGPAGAAGFVPFGTHSGSATLTLVEPNGAIDTIKGTMSGTIACGTHRYFDPACEDCRVHLHFEGCFNGRYVSGPIYDKYIANGLPAPTIKTTYAGQFLQMDNWPCPPNPPTVKSVVVMAIDGVHSFPCPP